LEIRPETGRKHQIRLALAHRANPILGDRKYGSTKSFPSGIALHARELVVEHPVRKTPLRLIAPLPSAWSSFGLGAGQRK
jgi:23S rRNA pseudouridine1911/1915/1917 synthase